MTNDVTITIPGLKKPLPGKLPLIGQYQRWKAASIEAGPGATISLACALIGLCLVHVSAFATAWRKHGDVLMFGDEVLDLLLNGGVRMGGDHAGIKGVISESNRIESLIGEKMEPYIAAVDLADFSPAQTEPETSP